MREPGTPPVIGVIGGSGIYDIDGLTDLRWKAVETPFGAPSDELLLTPFGAPSDELLFGHQMAACPDAAATAPAWRSPRRRILTASKWFFCRGMAEGMWLDRPILTSAPISTR